MEEYLHKLKVNLPINYPSQENDEYIEYLEKAYLINIESNTFQFSYIAFHLLFMSFLYKTVWQLNHAKYRNIQEVLGHHQEKLPSFSTPFDLSVLSEKTIPHLLSPLKIHSNTLEDFKMCIGRRDHCAHASGFVQYNETRICHFIEDELDSVNTIHEKTKDVIVKLFIKYIDDNWNPETRTAALGQDLIREFILENLISLNDLITLIEYPYSFNKSKSDELSIIHKKILFLDLLVVASDYFELNEEFIHDSFKQLFNGYDQKIEIDLESVIEDEFYYIRTEKREPLYQNYLFLKDKIEKLH